MYDAGLLREAAAGMRERAVFTVELDPDHPDRCPSIDPHDTLQCSRRIHDDDQCHCGGIAWRKGSPPFLDRDDRTLQFVADWLDRVAVATEHGGSPALFASESLAVARAYLGRDA